MKFTDNYKFRLPERDVEGGHDDAADINDLTYNWKNNDSVLGAQADAVKAVRDEADGHREAFPVDHPDGSVTDSKIGSRFIGAFSGGLQALFTAIGIMFKAVTGKERWNDAPDASLADVKKTMDGLNSHKEDAAAHVGEGDRQEWAKVAQKLDASVIVQETGSSMGHVMSQDAVTRAIASGSGGGSWDTLSGKPDSFNPAAHTHIPADITQGMIYTGVYMSSIDRRGQYLRNITVETATGIDANTSYILMIRK